MLKEFFESVVRTAQDSLRPTVLKPDAEPAHRYALALHSGEVLWFEAEPQPRQHKAGDIGTIAKLAATSSAKPVVWYSRKGVVLLCDDGTRRDQVRLDLRLHPQLVLLSELERTNCWHDQKAFIALLRIALNGLLPDTPLIESIRRLRFRKLDSGESIVQSNKASLGRTIESELTGSAPLPETVELEVPVFDLLSLAFTLPVSCALEIDPATEKFQLLPFPGQIESAIADAENMLGEELRILLSMNGEEVPLYFGAP